MSTRPGFPRLQTTPFYGAAILSLKPRESPLSKNVVFPRVHHQSEHCSGITVVAILTTALNVLRWFHANRTYAIGHRNDAASAADRELHVLIH